MTDHFKTYARIAEIDAQCAELYDERDHLYQALCAEGRARAKRSMKAAGFAFGESIIADNRGHGIGVLINLEVHAPWKSDGNWRIVVWYRSIRKSGRLGQKLGGESFSVPAPEQIPEKMLIAGSTNREKALDHPRIIRADKWRKLA